jgi:hypothetical protein
MTSHSLQGVDDNFVINGHLERYVTALPELRKVALYRSPSAS